MLVLAGPIGDALATKVGLCSESPVEPEALLVQARLVHEGAIRGARVVAVLEVRGPIVLLLPDPGIEDPAHQAQLGVVAHAAHLQLVVVAGHAEVVLSPSVRQVRLGLGVAAGQFHLVGRLLVRQPLLGVDAGVAGPDAGGCIDHRRGARASRDRGVDEASAVGALLGKRAGSIQDRATLGQQTLDLPGRGVGAAVHLCRDRRVGHGSGLYGGRRRRGRRRLSTHPSRLHRVCDQRGVVGGRRRRGRRSGRRSGSGGGSGGERVGALARRDLVGAVIDVLRVGEVVQVGEPVLRPHLAECVRQFAVVRVQVGVQLILAQVLRSRGSRSRGGGRRGRLDRANETTRRSLEPRLRGGRGRRGDLSDRTVLQHAHYSSH